MLAPTRLPSDRPARCRLRPPKDGDSNGTSTCDIGAFEADEGTNPSPTPSPTHAKPDTYADTQPNADTQRDSEAITERFGDAFDSSDDHPQAEPDTGRRRLRR